MNAGRFKAYQRIGVTVAPASFVGVTVVLALADAGVDTDDWGAGDAGAAGF